MPAIDLTIAAWQSSLREIGVLEFVPTESATERFPYWKLPDTSTFLGVLECDALCLLADGRLCLYDHEIVNRTLCMAAPNQTSLVAALCEMDVFFERCADDGDLADDESADRQMREECTKLIGGSEYAEFVQLFFWS